MDVALVIAGTSFVGRHLCRQLAQRNIAYSATTRTPQRGFVRCDLTCSGEIHGVIQSVQPRWIFNCAGATAHSNPEEMHALHVTATESLLEAVALDAPDAVTVLFGSAAEYGPVPPELLPIREDTPARPTSAYGQSKLALTQTAERLAHTHGLRVHVVRPFNLLGPGLGKQFLAASLCERLLKAKLLCECGVFPVANGQATRDWVDVRDGVDAVLRLALDALPTCGSLGIFNIATGVESSVLALAEHLGRLAGGFHATDAGQAESRSGIDRSCGDASRLRAATGWRPRVQWQQSVVEMWASVVSGQ
jgi:GDP-4-dehydro-6-deoxy-D-mannose reductase